MICGPDLLGLIPKEAVTTLRFVDQISLAYIAFAAGRELYLEEVRPRFRSIKRVTICLVIATFVLGGATIFMLADAIPVIREMSVSGRIAVSILGGAILVARSPSSAIAVINELRARGPFVQTVLGVTVVMDVAVIVLFALNSCIADTLLTGKSFPLISVALVSAELLMTVVLGYILGKVLAFVLSLNINHLFNAGMILLLGYGAFGLSDTMRCFSHQNLPFEILLEPLLICLVGGFVITNFSPYRNAFKQVLFDTGPLIYTIFFTLTGASLSLDILVKTWPIALVLFSVRIIAIFIGAFGGGVLAGDTTNHNRIAWMAYVTQAGIGLGLAKQIAVEFPQWGHQFATVMIAVIMLNQLIGPVLFKWAVMLAGEAHPRASSMAGNGIHNAIIFGLERQSIALARKLISHDWQPKIVCLESTQQKKPVKNDVPVIPIPEFSLATLHQVETKKADAIVALLSDEENLRICELAYEFFGTETLIVRLNDRTNFDRFHQMGALIVDPGTTFVSLLDHFVRSPSGSSLLLGMEENQDIADVELLNADFHGIKVRDLSLPLDILIMTVRRGDELMISHGYTRLKIGDRLTVVGSPEGLEQVALKFGSV